jgi:putative transposase
LFLFEVKRKVQKDRTVSLNGVVYEVDAALVGETVTLRFDPSAPAQRPLQVCHQGRPSGLARVVEPYANCFVKRERPSRTLPPLMDPHPSRRPRLCACASSPGGYR